MTWMGIAILVLISIAPQIEALQWLVLGGPAWVIVFWSTTALVRLAISSHR